MEVNEIKNQNSIIGLFPTPFYISETLNIDDSIVGIVQQYDKQLLQPNDPKSSSRSSDTFVLNRQELKDIKNLIDLHVTSYFHSMLSIDTSVRHYVTQSWIVTSKMNQHVTPEPPTNTIYSGFILLSDRSENIMMCKPFNSYLDPGVVTFDFMYSKPNQYNTPRADLKITPNKICLYPAALGLVAKDHARADYDRTFLRFNIFFEGSLGGDLRLTDYLSITGNH
jgi:hypothetical protein